MSVVVAPRVCPCSLFAASTVPVNESVADGVPLELGVRFRAKQAGWVTGVRFYKNERNTASTGVTCGPRGVSCWRR